MSFSRHIHDFHRVLTFGLCAVLVSACAVAQAPLENVTLQLKWKHQFQFAGYYAAIEKGYYREAGLNVDIREVNPAKETVDVVLDKEAQFGVASSELVLAFGQGKPVVMLAPIFQHSPLVLIASAEAGVDNIHSLVGKRVMIHNEEAELYAYFEAEGVPITRLQMVPATFSAADLIARKVDALSGYSTDEPFDLHEAGFQFVTLNPRAGGIDFYGDTLFTSDAELRANPERVRRFLDASIRGWRYALEHRDEIIDLILAKYTQRHSKAHLVFEAEESARLIQPELVELGYTNPGRWQRIGETYTQLHMMPPLASLDGFIYERNPRPGNGWLTLALAASLAGTMIVLAFAVRFYRLSKTVRQQAESLQAALDDIKTLRGVIPICSYCKKVRDDQGAWSELEHYVHDHSDAAFSHGICHECLPKVKASFDIEREESKRRKAMPPKP